MSNVISAMYKRYKIVGITAFAKYMQALMILDAHDGLTVRTQVPTRADTIVDTRGPE